MKFQWIANRSGSGGRRSLHQSQSLCFSGPRQAGCSSPLVSSAVRDTHSSGRIRSAVSANCASPPSANCGSGGGSSTGIATSSAGPTHHSCCGTGAMGYKTRARHPSVRIGERVNYVNTPHVICMVGLPARGKTYIASKLTRYLNWIGINTRIFNVGQYRRKMTNDFQSHDFFRSDNAEAMAMRARCAMDCMQDVCNWLENDGGEVAVFDATNSTRERRQTIYDVIVTKMGYKLFFVESLCDDPEIIEANIREVKVHGPDYEVINNKDEALADFLLRIKHYQDSYQTMDEAEEKHLSFLKIINTGHKIVVHRHEGHIQSRVVYYLMNIHVAPRSIYLTRHGESLLNLKGRIGGDGDLSPRGQHYAQALSDYIKSQNIPNLRVWTSWLKRTIQTASTIDAPQERWKALNEIDAGICEEMTYEEIQELHPEEFAARDEDKFHYRYPRGESYEDLVGRLEPVIMELERQENVLVIGHQAVLRCLLAYFLEKSADELPYIKVPLHTVIKLSPVAYGCRLEFIPLNIDAVDTHRAKPIVSGTLEDRFRGLLARGFDETEEPSAPDSSGGGGGGRDAYWGMSAAAAAATSVAPAAGAGAGGGRRSSCPNCANQPVASTAVVAAAAAGRGGVGSNSAASSNTDEDDPDDDRDDDGDGDDDDSSVFANDDDGGAEGVIVASVADATTTTTTNETRLLAVS